LRAGFRSYELIRAEGDTLPVADGVLEAGSRVPLERLQPAMEDWFRRKSYLKPGEGLEVVEIGGAD